MPIMFFSIWLHFTSNVCSILINIQSEFFFFLVIINLKRFLFICFIKINYFFLYLFVLSVVNFDYMLRYRPIAFLFFFFLWVKTFWTRLVGFGVSFIIQCVLAVEVFWIVWDPVYASLSVKHLQALRLSLQNIILLLLSHFKRFVVVYSCFLWNLYFLKFLL